MVETIPERHLRDRMQSIMHLANLSEAERAKLSWQDHQDLVQLCVALSQSAREVMEKEFGRIFKNPNLTVAWLRERRHVIVELCDIFVQLVQTIRPSAVQAWQAAVSPKGKDFAWLLDSALKEVSEAKHSFLERWPVGSAEEVAELRAADARGEVPDADQAFAEIAGMDVESWRKSVEEYKLRENWSAGG